MCRSARLGHFRPAIMGTIRPALTAVSNDLHFRQGFLLQSFFQDPLDGGVAEIGVDPSPAAGRLQPFRRVALSQGQDVGQGMRAFQHRVVQESQGHLEGLSSNPCRFQQQAVPVTQQAGHFLRGQVVELGVALSRLGGPGMDGYPLEVFGEEPHLLDPVGQKEALPDQAERG